MVVREGEGGGALIPGLPGDFLQEYPALGAQPCHFLQGSSRALSPCLSGTSLVHFQLMVLPAPNRMQVLSKNFLVRRAGWPLSSPPPGTDS